ncbi:MAG TPA: hypothetical protein VGI78_23870, partial [Acetobacteraceae bacterium]
MLAPFRFRDQPLDRGGKRRQVFPDDVPYRQDVGTLIIVSEQMPIATICRQGMLGASALRSSGTCRLASEMISSTRSTARYQLDQTEARVVGIEEEI